MEKRMAKNQQIKNIRIDVSTKGSKDAEAALSDINKELIGIQDNAAKIGGFIKGPVKSLETLYSRAKPLSEVFSAAANSASKMNTALNGNTAKANKNISGYMDNLELVSISLIEVARNAERAGNALDRVNATTSTNATVDAMDDLYSSLIDVVEELKELNVGSKITTSRLKDIRELIGDTGIASNRAAEELEDLNRGFLGLGTASDRVNPRLRETDNNLRRLGGSGSSGARAFSSMAFGMNPLTTLYAKLAINIYALTEAFRLLGEFSDTSRLIENLGVLSANAGVNLSSLAKEIQNVSGASLSLEDASRLAARSVAQGFASKQMIELTQNAKRASIALGINFTDAMDRLTKGIAKQEVELLDELGIVTRLEPAMKKYAESIGKTVDQLTDAERTTSLYVEANKQLRDSFGEISVAASGVEVFTKAVSSAVSKLGQALVKELNPYLKKIGAALNDTFINGIGDAKSFEDALEKTIVSVNKRGEAGGVANAFRIANIVADGTDKLIEQNAAVSALKKEEERLNKLRLSAEKRIANVRKYSKTPEEGEERAQKIMFQFRSIGAEIVKNNEDLAQANLAIEIYNNKLAVVADKLGLNSFDNQELRDMSVAFNVLSGSSAATISNFDKFSATLLDNRGPLAAVVKSLKATSDQYDDLASKVVDNPVLYEDMFRLEKDTLEGINKQFDSQFVSLDAALDYVSKLNVELYSFAEVLAEIDGTKGFNSLDKSQSKLAAITKRLADNSNALTVTEKTLLEAQKDKLVIAIDLEKSSMRILALSRAQELSAQQLNNGGTTEVDILKNKKKQLQEAYELKQKEFGYVGEALKQQKASNDFEQAKLDILIKQAQAKRDLYLLGNELDIGQSQIKGVVEDRKDARARVGSDYNNYAENQDSQILKSAELASKSQELNAAEASGTMDPAVIASMKEEVRVLNEELRRLSEAAPRALFDDWKLGMESIASIPGLDSMTSQLISASSSMGEALFDISESFANNNANMMENVGQAMQAGAEIASTIIGSLSDAKVKDIDRQIAAEQKRDGKSAESLAKIKKLEAKKIKEKAKADKAQVVMSTAVAVIRAFADLGWPAGIPAAAIAAASGAFQLSQIDKAANGSVSSLSGGPSAGMKITGGNRDNSIDVSKSASMGEYAFLSGGMGQGDASNFSTPGRAGGGMAPAGVGVTVGERGPEEVTPSVPVSVATAGNSGAGVNLNFSPVFNAHAVNSAGMEGLFKEYSKELYEGLEAELNANSRSLRNLQ